MKRNSTHYDWLRLVEVSGPFLSATVLDEAFPTGLDGFDKRTKRELSRYYDEWLEAYESKDPQFEALHQAWCEAVLRDGLQFQDGDLSDGAAWSVKGEGGVGTFAADKMLKGVDGKPAMFIKVLSEGTKPSDRALTDEWKDTYIEKMTRLCRAHEVRIGLLTNGEQWVLVNAAPGGTLSGHVVWYARLWFQEDSTLRAFLALLGYSRFAGSPKKRLPFLLDESLKHLEEVTDTLGQQVMTAVEVLLEGLDRADLDSGRTLLRDIDPKELYEASLTVMMRLVFILARRNADSCCWARRPTMMFTPFPPCGSNWRRTRTSSARRSLNVALMRGHGYSRHSVPCLQALIMLICACPRWAAASLIQTSIRSSRVAPRESRGRRRTPRRFRLTTARCCCCWNRCRC